MFVIPMEGAENLSARRLAKFKEIGTFLQPLMSPYRRSPMEPLLCETWEGNLVMVPLPDREDPAEEMDSKTFFQKLMTDRAETVVERPQFRDGFALGAAESFQAVCVMSPEMSSSMNYTLAYFSEFTGLTNPSVRLLARGLNVVTLSADSATGVLALKAYSKTEPAAENLVRLLELWKSEILAKGGDKSLLDEIQLVRDGRTVTLVLGRPEDGRIVNLVRNLQTISKITTYFTQIQEMSRRAAPAAEAYEAEAPAAEAYAAPAAEEAPSAE